MSTYSPSPDDLVELPMPDEWRRIADGVLPGNREQMAEQMAENVARASAALEELGRAFAKIAADLTEALRPFVAAMNRLIQRFAPLTRRARGGRQPSQTVRYFDRKGRAHFRPLRV